MAHGVAPPDLTTFSAKHRAFSDKIIDRLLKEVREPKPEQRKEVRG